MRKRTSLAHQDGHWIRTTEADEREGALRKIGCERTGAVRTWVGAKLQVTRR